MTRRVTAPLAHRSAGEVMEGSDDKKRDDENKCDDEKKRDDGEKCDDEKKCDDKRCDRGV